MLRKKVLRFIVGVPVQMCRGTRQIKFSLCCTLHPIRMDSPTWGGVHTPHKVILTKRGGIQDIYHLVYVWYLPIRMGSSTMERCSHSTKKFLVYGRDRCPNEEEYKRNIIFFFYLVPSPHLDGHAYHGKAPPYGRGHHPNEEQYETKEKKFICLVSPTALGWAPLP